MKSLVEKIPPGEFLFDPNLGELIQALKAIEKVEKKVAASLISTASFSISGSCGDSGKERRGEQTIYRESVTQDAPVPPEGRGTDNTRAILSFPQTDNAQKTLTASYRKVLEGRLKFFRHAWDYVP